MAKLLRFTLAVVFFGLTSLSLSQVQAAPSGGADSQATVNIEVKVDNPTIFWDLSYLTKESLIAKPAYIKIDWDAKADTVKTSGSETVVMNGASSGKLSIRTTKDTQINYQVIIVGTNNTILGTLSMQVRNSGVQNKVITVSPPEISLPNIVYGDNTTPSNYKNY
ncbi:MAG: hypothetical protein H6Q75_90 [Firmicutes bacterium]|nr:hypothetical protein [Bacillota bacterium]